MAFFGCVVKPGKPTPVVPHPDEGINLHLSQCCLLAGTPKGKRVSLMVNHNGEDPIAVATMTSGTLDSIPLDLFFSEYAEFTLQGDAVEVHMTGYYSPAIDPEMGEGGEDEEGIPGGYEFGESEEEDGDEDMDEDEDEDEDEDDIPSSRGRQDVIIKELDANGEEMEEGEGQEGEEEEEEEDEEDEGEEEEDEDEGEEEDDPPSVPVLSAGSKRPLEAQTKPQQHQDPSSKRLKEPQLAGSTAAKLKEDTKSAAAAPKAKQAETPTPKPKEGPKTQEAAAGSSGKAGEVKSGKKSVRRWENGFEIEDVSMGPPAGKLAKSGKRVFLHYTGKLKSNGKVFDKSSGKPFAFRLGVGEVIKGWDLGVEGMRVGDKRHLTIPAQLAYGSSGVRGTIPPNATLEFDVQLVDVK